MSEKKSKDWRRVREENACPDIDDALPTQPDDESEDGETGTTGGGQEGLEHLSYEALEEKLTQAEQRAHDNWDKATRAVAELENVRRRAERDVAQAHKYSLERFVDGLLPVIDSLETALQLVDVQANQSMHEGLSLTMKLFGSVLSKFQVEPIDPLGQMFNPQEHEAMSMVEADVPPSSIIQVFQKGYKLNERVIRPARVVVAK